MEYAEIDVPSGPPFSQLPVNDIKLVLPKIDTYH